jgi:hypothetical protein
MGAVLLSILTKVVAGLGKFWIDAAYALDSPPRTLQARRYRTTATCFFLSGAATLLWAALADVAAGNRPLSEVLGWTGITCLHGSAFCGIRYGQINQNSLDGARGTSIVEPGPPTD